MVVAAAVRKSSLISQDALGGVRVAGSLESTDGRRYRALTPLLRAATHPAEKIPPETRANRSPARKPFRKTEAKNRAAAEHGGGHPHPRPHRAAPPSVSLPPRCPTLLRSRYTTTAAAGLLLVKKPNASAASQPTRPEQQSTGARAPELLLPLHASSPLPPSSSARAARLPTPPSRGSPVRIPARARPPLPSRVRSPAAGRPPLL